MPTTSQPARSSARRQTTTARGDASPLDDLPALLSRIHIHFQALVERTLTDLELEDVLRPGMSPVLFALYERDGCIIKDLAERTKRSAAALNSLLGRLEKAGVVALRACEHDGRAVRVRLTAKGRQIEPRVRELHRRVAAAVEQELAPGEPAQVSGMLRRIIAGMKRGETARN